MEFELAADNYSKFYIYIKLFISIIIIIITMYMRVTCIMCIRVSYLTRAVIVIIPLVIRIPGIRCVVTSTQYTRVTL